MFFQPRQAILEETLAPHADDLAPGVESGGDLIVGQAFGGEEDHPGPDHLKIRQRILGGAPAQFPLFGGGEHYREWTGAWHRKSDLASQDAIREWIYQLQNTCVYL